MKKNSSSLPSFATPQLGNLIGLLGSLIAVGIHAYLTWEFYQIKLGLSATQSLCNISSTFNCEVVAASPFAQVLGIPVALFGLVANSIFFVLTAKALLFSDSSSKTKDANFILAILILAASVVMGIISATQLRVYCLFCLAAYGTSILVFAGAWISNQGRKLDLQFSPGSTGFRALMSLFSIPVLAFLGHQVMAKQLDLSKYEIVMQESLNDWSSGATHGFDLEAGFVFQKGEGVAPIQIVEFIDLLCPHCKVATPILHDYTDKRTDTRLVVKFYPLDGGCSTEERMPKGDGIRCQWASAVVCAKKIKNRGWEALNWVLENQSGLYGVPFENRIQDFLKPSQLTEAELRSCMADPTTSSAVRSMANEGVQAGVEGTPTVFLNGRKVPRGQSPVILKNISNHILNQK